MPENLVTCLHPYNCTPDRCRCAHPEEQKYCRGIDRYIELSTYIGSAKITNPAIASQMRKQGRQNSKLLNQINRSEKKK